VKGATIRETVLGLNKGDPTRSRMRTRLGYSKRAEAKKARKRAISRGFSNRWKMAQLGPEKAKKGENARG